MKKLQWLVSASFITVSFIAVYGFANKQTSAVPAIRSSSDNIMVSGGGSFEELGSKTTYTFNAIQQQNGRTIGHLILHFRAAGGTLNVNLDCLRLFGDNKATLSGVIAKVSVKGDEEPPPFIYVGGRVSFTVQDNGEGGTATKDLVSDIGVLDLNVPASCSDEMATYLPLSGNVQINR